MVTTHTKQKQVTFGNNDEYFFQDSTSKEEDLERKWYTAKERAAFFDDINKTLQKFEKKGGNMYALNEEKFCLRGLEEAFDPAFPNCRTERKQFMRALVALQKEHKEFFGEVDIEKVKRMCSTHSIKSTLYAQENARQDHIQLHQKKSDSNKSYWNRGKLLPSGLLGIMANKRSS